jgi:hypothetical protein
MEEDDLDPYCDDHFDPDEDEDEFAGLSPSARRYAHAENYLDGE